MTFARATDLLDVPFPPVRIRAADLRLSAEAQTWLVDDAIVVPAETHDFVAYGPYTQLPTGTFRVSFEIQGDAPGDLPLADVDLFCEGQVLAAGTVTQARGVVLTCQGPLSALEVRVRSRGSAFRFTGIGLERIAKAAGPRPARPTATVDVMEAVWRTLHGPRPELASCDWATIAVGAEAAAEIWLTAVGPAAIIDCSSEAALQASALTLHDLGLSVSALRLARLDLFDIQSAAARSQGRDDVADDLERFAQTVEPGFCDLFLDGLVQSHGVDQFTALASGRTLCPCPYSGVLLESRHALPAPVQGAKCVYTFHRFDGVKPYYLVLGGFGGRRMFVYLPLEHILLQLTPPQYVWGTLPLAVDMYRRLATTQAPALVRYLKAQTRLALFGGTIDNLGHYFWNDVAGALRFAKLGLLDRVHEELRYTSDFLDLAALAGRGASASQVQTSPRALFARVLERGLLPVRPVAMRIGAETEAAVRAYVDANLSGHDRAELTEGRRSDKIVVFNLRAHNKAWREQIDGALAVAAGAKARQASLTLYLDGMADTADIATTIAERAPAGVRVVAGHAKPMVTTLAWAFACDGYVATIGSGLTILTWLAQKRGVAHSEQAHLGQAGFWAEVRPGAPPLMPVAREWVRDLGDGGAYCNYSIDPHRVAAALWRILSAEAARG